MQNDLRVAATAAIILLAVAACAPGVQPADTRSMVAAGEMVLLRHLEHVV